MARRNCAARSYYRVELLLLDGTIAPEKSGTIYPPGVYSISVVSSKLNLDKLGACASAICAVHCMLTGVAIGLLSVAGLGFLDSFWTDFSFISVACVIGSWAAWHGKKKHHSWLPASVFVFSLGLVVIGHFVIPHHSAGSTWLSVGGGCGLVLFHWLNFRLQSHEGCPDCQRRAAGALAPTAVVSEREEVCIR